MAKNFIILLVFLLSINHGFSTATYGYNNADGYVFLANNAPAIGINITLNCSSSINNFFHHTLTNSSGFYSFAGISDVYNSSASSATCIINSSKQGVSPDGINSFTFAITQGDSGPNRGAQVNFTYNNTGTAIFNFTGLNGHLKSLDNELIKNQNITLICPGNQETMITNNNGFYEGPITSWSYSCNEDRSDGCDILCNISNSGIYTNFYINPQGSSGGTINVSETKNATYPFLARVNGEFFPNAPGIYGNITHFIYNASKYSHEIYSCQYSLNNSEMMNFNESNLAAKIFIADISINESGIRNYHVLCNTSLSTEILPKTAIYDFRIDGANMEINFPLNSSLFSRNSIFNITTNIPVNYCWFNITNSSNGASMHYARMENITSTNHIYYAINDSKLHGLPVIKENENNTAIFSCIDNYGIISSKNVSFNAKITPPPRTDYFSARITDLGSVILTWNPVQNASRYHVYRAQAGQGGLIFSMIMNVSSESTHSQDLNAQRYQTYYYAITAIDNAGNEGAMQHSSAVYIISNADYKKEIIDLSSELDAFKNESLIAENELKEKNQAFAEISIINQDIEFLSRFAGFLSLFEIEAINNAKALLANHESMDLNQLKSAKQQAEYSLSIYLKDYQKEASSKTEEIIINSLNISSKIIESILKANGKTYYHYELTITALNPLDDKALKNIQLSIPLPEDAIILDGDEYLSPINSLSPKETHEITYAFATLSPYEFTAQASLTQSSVPQALSAYNVLKEQENNYLAIIAFIAIIVGAPTLFLFKKIK
ncbi:MAG: hypothetical protein PHT91_00695 [Candidatus Nanoarchaeia archaeon]|nr:hypothetical protein [Candidatus Nanoarchaeia archaeon]MDD5053782.1 hypothetical protein [Candidatus Nanoarchaeia archaeon]MDD5499378.1 hypothetical protein [Candidatus Nanoarchaeia archaeon]